MRIYILLILLVFNLYGLVAQETKNDLSYYFSDKVQEKKSVIKTDLLSYIRGEFNISYERAISKTISVELGLGRYLTHYKRDFLLFGDNEEQTDYRKENSTTLNTRIKFYQQEALFGIYRSISFKYSDHKQLRLYDFGFELGYQPYISKRFAFDFTCGLVMRCQDAGNEFYYYEDHDIGFLIVFRAMVGYRY